ncbi:hypothetical protein MNL04_06660 [Bartonella krasnovii]|uniref:hypothetical protein n=1 Tax=Bartonella krasnovii TaxID=2267275 RepID=UPI001F4CB014|nr:hypothetical protein [Bartonella krasnovii]UNF48375.1 hypothetical protein MNL04_06660 [Bartonella krasnovii]
MRGSRHGGDGSLTGKLKTSSVFSLGEWGCCIFVLSIGVAFGAGCFWGGLLWGEVLFEGGGSKGVCRVIEKRVGAWCVRGKDWRAVV